MLLQESIKKEENLNITYDSDWDEILVKSPSPERKEIVIDLVDSD